MGNYLDYKLILSNIKQSKIKLESEINNRRYLVKAFKFIDLYKSNQHGDE